MMTVRRLEEVATGFGSLPSMLARRLAGAASRIALLTAHTDGKGDPGTTRRVHSVRRYLLRGNT